MRAFGEVLLLVGAAWTLLAAIGVNRFGDIYARMHAATKSTTLGVLLLLVGTGVILGGMSALKLLLAGGLLFLTAPIGAHLVGRAVHRNQGQAPMRIDVTDELRDAEADEADPGLTSE